MTYGGTTRCPRTRFAACARRASARRPGTASWMLIMLSRRPVGTDSDHTAQSVRRRQPAHVAADLYAWLQRRDELACRTDLGHLLAWPGLPTPVHPNTRPFLNPT